MKISSMIFLIAASILLIALPVISDSQILSKDNSAVCMSIIKPKTVTEALPHDTDDPAIWIDQNDIKKSLILGTDKNIDGGLYVFDIDGHILKDKTVAPLKRPNNVDIEYGMSIGGKLIDIAVATERLTHKLRVFSLPDMLPVDKGGIEVFKGEAGIEARDLMGIAIYKRSSDGAVFAVAGRKTGPSGSYLWQYLLHDDGAGNIMSTLVRKFGEFSGRNEIEAIAVDDELGFIYYSDEGVGVRKYYADPVMGNKQLALFATEGFSEDHEGISIYQTTTTTGYIIVSDQGADKFHIFPREGTADNPHSHPLIKVVKVAAHESDGSDVTSVALGDLFPKGLFVAMSNDRTFHYYSWEDIMDTP